MPFIRQNCMLLLWMSNLKLLDELTVFSWDHLAPKQNPIIVNSSGIWGTNVFKILQAIIVELRIMIRYNIQPSQVWSNDEHGLKVFPKMAI